MTRHNCQEVNLPETVSEIYKGARQKHRLNSGLIQGRNSLLWSGTVIGRESKIHISEMNIPIQIFAGVGDFTGKYVGVEAE
jgi:hypothetical protein